MTPITVRLPGRPSVQLIGRCYALRYVIRHKGRKLVPVPRVEKSLHLCLAGLRIRRFDPIAEASELPDHLPSTPLLRFFGDRWAPFFGVSLNSTAMPESRYCTYAWWYTPALRPVVESAVLGVYK